MGATVTSLREWLVEAGIAGPHLSHGRDDNLRKAELLATGDPDLTFGIAEAAEAGGDEALAAMAKLAGAAPGEAYIDPEATIDAAVTAARKLREACRAGARIFLATGHPTGLLPFWMRLATAVARCGGEVVRPAEEAPLPHDPGHRRLRYFGGVGVLIDGGNLLHLHLPWPMERILAAGEAIDLVVADHGFAGGAVEAGIPAVAAMDTNDHALAVAWDRGRDVTPIPMDDNRPPDLYRPLAELMERELER